MLPDNPITRRIIGILAFGLALVALPFAIAFSLGAIGLVVLFVLGVIALCLALAVATWIASKLFGETRVKAAFAKLGIDFEREDERRARGGSPLAYPRRKLRPEEIEDAVILEEIPPEK